MKKTQSEKFFEQYCTNSGLACKPISEEKRKTPDYELTIDGQRIVVEVKEFDRNKDEQESDRLLSERGYGNVLSDTPGGRVRKKIADSSAQIKARTQGTYPSILVLFDPVWQGIGHLHSDNIKFAMCGLPQTHIVVPRNRSVSPYPTGMSYGPKRKMTEEHNTSISAIGVLLVSRTNEIALDVYHNKFAAVPLDANLLSRHGIRQFELESEVPGKTAKWKEVAIR